MTMYDDAMRTIIELPDSLTRALGELCRREKISRAEAVRRAVAAYLRERSPEQGADAFGLWRDRRVDALRYQRRLRSEWSRR